MGRRLKVYDRSRSTTDWQCQRRRYLQYELYGRGVVPGSTAIELFLGTVIHDGLAAIAHNATIDEIAVKANEQILGTLSGDGTEDEVNYAQEQAALVEGMLRGFYKHAWPKLIATYPKILAIEQEMTYEHDGLTFMSKPDLVLANADESEIVYVEYKSTSSKKDSWVNSWGYAVQLHSTIRAIESSLGKKVTGVIVQGLYKGFESYGKQSSPFCYLYFRPANPPFVKEEVAYEFKAGLKRYPTWEREGGVKAWVDNMPTHILADQFPQTPMIFIKEDLIDNFFAQRSAREQEIDLAMQMIEMHEGDEEMTASILNTAFEQKFDQCYPYFGKPCSYRDICHGSITDPLNQGYTIRESHHALEAEAHKKEDELPEAVNQ